MKLCKINLMTLLVALPVSALGASHIKIVYIDQYDSNSDDKVSSVEFESVRRERFNFTDENGNGVLDEEEYVFEYEDRMDAQLIIDRREQVQQTATRFDSLDNNADDNISWAEYEASGLWSFNLFDTNEDGLINRDDDDPMAEAVARQEAEMSREDILRDRSRVLSMPSTHNREGTIAQYDRDGDGAVTLGEFTSLRQENYQRMDENGNNGVNEDEYLAEFEDRLDAEIAADRRAHVEQTYVRFGVMDSDENGLITFEEYQSSGHRSFKRWDTDGDGFVTLEEPDPLEPEFPGLNQNG